MFAGVAYGRAMRPRDVKASERTPPDRRRAAAEDLARAGGRDASVEIVGYDPAWPVASEAERTRLAPLLEGAEIHHFGSTAVPGLAAKPVIDMIVLVGDLDAPIAALVERAGYQFPRAFNATLAHRRFLCFRRPPTAPILCISWTSGRSSTVACASVTVYARTPCLPASTRR
jgi:GrpB-like predicted nucleotidyltransferase (UPF0157 family)